MSEPSSADLLIEQLVILANSIYHKLNNELIQENVDPYYTYEFICSIYKDFCDAHPVVIREMIFSRFYDEGVFRKYLVKYYKTHVPQNMNDFGDLQADYMKYIYMHICKKEKKRYSAHQAKQIWLRESNNINRIMTSMVKEEKQIREQSIRETTKHNRERREELNEFLSTYDFSQFDDDDVESMEDDVEFAKYLSNE